MKNIAIVGKNLILAPSMFSIVVRSLAAVIIGIYLIIDPMGSIKILTMLLGVLVFLIGAFSFVGAGKAGSAALKNSLRIIAGIVAAAGLFMACFPGSADFTVLVLFAFITLASGIQQLAGAGASGHKQLLIFSGLISLLIGLLIIVAPDNFMAVIGLVAGIYLVCFGMFTFAWALALRRKK